jgi:hypothetical protein
MLKLAHSAFWFTASYAALKFVVSPAVIRGMRFVRLSQDLAVDFLRTAPADLREASARVSGLEHSELGYFWKVMTQRFDGQDQRWFSAAKKVGKGASRIFKGTGIGAMKVLGAAGSCATRIAKAGENLFRGRQK